MNVARTISFLLVLVSIPWSPACRNSARAEDSTQTVHAGKHATVASIENGLLHIAVDPKDGKLLELVDLRARHNHVGDSEVLGGLWELQLVSDDRQVALKPADAKAFRWEILAPKQRGLRLMWSGFRLPAASECQVEVTVRLEDGESTSRWEIAVERAGGIELHEVRFPRLSGLRRQTDERLAVPAWMGELVVDLRSRLRGPDGRGRRLSWNYPGRLSMQCLAFYGSDACGLDVTCDDTAAMKKTYSFWGDSDGDVHFEMIHYPVNQTDRTRRYALPYRVLLGAFRGDWVTAAERYRKLATNQPWARQSRLRRGLVPDWVVDTSLWVWNRGSSPGVLPPAATLREKLGLPVGVFWHWWHGCSYDDGFPEYLPPREGTETFQRAVARAHDDGLRMLVYMNQRAWGTSTKSWKTEGAERFAVKGRDGKVHSHVYNIFTGQPLATMCLGTTFWRNKYAGLSEEAFKELGVDGIYMDQACSHQSCYDPNHGHPVGGGNSWIKGFRILSEDIRNRSNVDRRIVLAGEGCGEAWLPYLDLMLALQVSRERYSRASSQVIPFFQAVYHPYAITYGSYSSLTIPPYDELWPAEFAPKHPLALLDRKHSRQFYLEQARAFVWGSQPTLANFLPSQLEQRSEEIEYVVRLARVRSRVAKYLLRGEFLRPPKLDVPWITSDFSRLSIYAGQKDRVASFKHRHPSAIAGAWRAADGDVAIALASIVDEPLSLSIPLDPKYYGLEKEPRAYRIDETGRFPIKPLAGDGLSLKLELPARQAWIIEFPRAR